MRYLGCKFLSIETDQDGLNPDSLRQVLSSRWSPEDAVNPASDLPKVLYTVPVAGNPSGVSLTLERKKEIYKVQYDRYSNVLASQS